VRILDIGTFLALNGILSRRNLESWLPPHLHSDINPMLVGFGQVICTPTRPSCDKCTLSTTGLCPSAEIVSKSSRKTSAKVRTGAKVEIEIELEEDVLPLPPV
jgi:endonuclease-3